MTNQDNSLKKFCEKIGRPEAFDVVLNSPQTEFSDGKLISVDISDLELVFLPEDVFNDLEHLERVHAGFNKIESLPPKLFAKIPNIKFINFYANQLTSLPDDIFEGLKKIEWLDLRSNQLSSLPKSLGKLDSLKYLYLQNNSFENHSEYNWSADFHSKRDVAKFMPEFQEAMGLEVTGKKPPTRQEIAESELKKRETTTKKK